MFWEEMEGLDVSLSLEKTMDQVKTFSQMLSKPYLGTPDGGSGGGGGDVYFRSTGRLSNLYDLSRAHFLGNNGKCGMVGI